MNTNEKTQDQTDPAPDLKNIPPAQITSDMVANAHAAGDGSLKRSDEDAKKETGTDSLTNKIPY